MCCFKEHARCAHALVVHVVVPANNNPNQTLSHTCLFTHNRCGCNNSAMFADIVPEHMRSKIYAFDRAFEGAVGACGLPLVGLTAERLFG